MIPSSSAPAFQTRFASLSLHMTDRLRFLRFPQEVIQACQQTVALTWRRGIQAARPYGRSFELKLNGNPWRGQGDQAMEARRLMYALLGRLHSLGWVMTLSTDVSKKGMDKDALLFRFQDPPPAECDWASIAFSKTDRIRFIDLPREIRDTVAAKLGRMVQEQLTYMPGIYEIKLYGSPWYASGEETMRARDLLLTLLETLEEEGWTVYASIDQKNASGDNYSETDTWHLCKPKGWIKGAPVYHS
ncbi:hypothetical protein K458DRAFT_414268 [Lentithecium fluviatile CBS 122367]|uniref:Uncharacterized protein n=1 Tax=Lentithecium fluviatile CBS 122367 TaxID=1168545 RepID=A0A6G1JE59_9PLEO|nr:hypothetical protein K458DRAFT_414268 [Lentithecium fluviatile CBS 122367]